MERVPAGGRQLLVGAGHMGTALLRGWLAAGAAPQALAVLDPKPSAEARALAAEAAIPIASDPAGIVGPVATLVLAVKPQAMTEVLAGLAGIDADLAITVAAGLPRKFYDGKLHARALARVMPNTPAAIGKGISGAVAEGLSGADRARVEAVLAPAGPVVWVADEAALDVLTAISGSGPAYVFFLVECLAEAGEAAGLPAADARRLARATVEGAGALLAGDPREAGELRSAVTSPGGTTAAALEVLGADRDGLKQLITRAVAAARDRAAELGRKA